MTCHMLSKSRRAGTTQQGRRHRRFLYLVCPVGHDGDVETERLHVLLSEALVQHPSNQRCFPLRNGFMRKVAPVRGRKGSQAREVKGMTVVDSAQAGVRRGEKTRKQSSGGSAFENALHCARQKRDGLQAEMGEKMPAVSRLHSSIV